MASSFSGSLRGGRNRKFKSEINVVPYIDVMLVLLVIFMVAAPLTNPNVVNLPTAGKSTLPPTQYIQVSLIPNAPATVQINGLQGRAPEILTAADRADLIDKLSGLHASHAELPVMIAADKDIKYDEVMQVLSAAKKLGIIRVGLATR